MDDRMSNAIIFENVSKAFGEVQALDAVSFDAPTGSVTVLLGPNGAGKTTTVRLTTGAMLCDVGAIQVVGLNPLTSGDEIRSRVGVVPRNQRSTTSSRVGRTFSSQQRSSRQQKRMPGQQQNGFRSTTPWNRKSAATPQECGPASPLHAP